MVQTLRHKSASAFRVLASKLAGFSRFSVRVVSFVLSRIGLIRMHESRTKKAMRSSLRE